MRSQRVGLFLLAMLPLVAGCLRSEPSWTNPLEPGAAELDFDHDGVANGQDNCPWDANPGQLDVCEAGEGEGSEGEGEGSEGEGEGSEGEGEGSEGEGEGEGSEGEGEGSEGEGEGEGSEGEGEGSEGEGEGSEGEGEGSPCVPGTINPAASKPEQRVRVCPGTFTMGSPANEPGHGDGGDEKQHPVTLMHGFLMQATEVTQSQWQTAMGDNPSSFGGCGGDCPVEQVNWYQVVAYCNARSLAEGLERCYKDGGGADYDVAAAVNRVTPAWPRGLACLGYRLPTEAEWEYAARAGTQTAFFTGAITQTACDPVDPNLVLAGWYCGNSGNTPHVVGGKRANAWGLYDMHGNVWEWCWDWHGDYPVEAVIDPLGSQAGLGRVVRGGSWDFEARNARAAGRSDGEPVSAYSLLGFRPVRSIP